MQPLEGVRVVEVATAVQGPAVGGFLADMGADVIKIEPPRGDANRWYRGHQNTLPDEVLGTQFIGVGSGKRSISLDIHTDLGKEVVYRLVDRADIFFSNYREEALGRMGLSYETLAKRNKQLIYGVANGFGHKGPDRTKPMSDQYAQARSGIAGVTGAPESETIIPGAIIGDTAGALSLTLGIMVAFAARERHGFGQKVSTSAYGALLWMQSWEVNHTSLTGNLPQKLGPFHPISTGVTGIYETSDGGAFCIGFGTHEAWLTFCEIGGIREITTDPRWDSQEKIGAMTFSPNRESENELRSHVAQAMRTMTTEEWSTFFEELGESARCQQVLNYQEILDDPQALENGYIVEKEIPHAGRHKVVGNPLQFSQTPAVPSTLFSELGEHTQEIMQALGFSPDEIASLEQDTIAGR